MYHKTKVALVSALLIFAVAIVQVESQKACQSKYEPYYNGTCMKPEDCLGAIIEENGCQIAGSKCCIPETNPLTIKFPLLNPTQAEDLVGLQNNRVRRIGPLLDYVQTNEVLSSQTCFRKAAFVSLLATASYKFMSSEDPRDDKYYDQFDFDSKFGNNATGDGAKYKPRGFVKFIGKKSYIEISKKLKMHNLVENPEMAAFPTVASRIASWYWSYREFSNDANGEFLSFSRLNKNFFGTINNLTLSTLLYEKAASMFNCGQIQQGESSSNQCKANNSVPMCKPLCVNGIDNKSYCGCQGLIYDNACPNEPSNVKCCSQKCSAVMDITLVLDSSGSIGHYEFQKVREFTANFISSLDIGETATRVAIINYSSTSQIIAKLSSTYDKNQLVSLANNIPYISSSTNTGGALQVCNDQIYQVANGMRPEGAGISKVVVVLTDGVSDYDPSPKAQLLKNRGITVISIGVGSGPNPKELKEMSSDGEYFLLKDFTAVLSFIDTLQTSSCRMPAVIPDETEKIKLDKNAFKYFSFPLKNFEHDFLALNVNEISGQSEFFYSFENKNPNDFEVSNAEDDPIDYSFLIIDEDDLKLKLLRMSRNFANSSVLHPTMRANEGLVNIYIPKGKNYENLYIGVKAKVENTVFEIKISKGDSKCQSKYEPFYNGTCMEPEECLGAVIEDSCQMAGVKCCIPEPYESTIKDPALNALEATELVGLENDRVKAIGPLLDYLQIGEVSTCFRKASFVSIFATATEKFMRSEKPGTDEELSRDDFLFGNEAIGDGAKYKARGFAMLKGKDRYKEAGLALKLPLVDIPEMAAFPAIASRIASWYWSKNGYSKYADGTFLSYSRLVKAYFGRIDDLKSATEHLENAAHIFQCGDIFKGQSVSDECYDKVAGAMCKPLCVSGLEGREFCGCDGDTYNGLCRGMPTNIKCCAENAIRVEISKKSIQNELNDKVKDKNIGIGSFNFNIIFSLLNVLFAFLLKRLF